jgi:hypothetical protein
MSEMESVENKISERNVVLGLTLGSILCVAVVSIIPEFAISQGVSAYAIAWFAAHPSYSLLVSTLIKVGVTIQKWKALLLLLDPASCVAFL